MILPYRLLETRLLNHRGKPYTYLHLFVVSMMFFLSLALLGGTFHYVLANFAYNFFMEPTIKGADKVTVLLGGSAAASALVLFLKNTTAVLVAIAFARRTRGISIILLLGLNALIIGSVLKALYAGGHEALWLAGGVLTHGIFEFTAIFLGAAYGLKILLASDEQLSQISRQVYLLGLKYLLPLLVVAAIVEAFITPLVLGKV